jgi:hypothetical protein
LWKVFPYHNSLRTEKINILVQRSCSTLESRESYPLSSTPPLFLGGNADRSRKLGWRSNLRKKGIKLAPNQGDDGEGESVSQLFDENSNMHE